MRTQTQKMKSVKYKNKKGKGMKTDERGKFSGVQLHTEDDNRLRTSLREIMSDVLQKDYEK